MKKLALFAFAATLALVGCKNSQPAEAQLAEDEAVVYLTKDISPEGLVKIYEALGVEAEGRVAVKISTGEAGNPNSLKPELIGGLVKLVNGKLVECNTTYGLFSHTENPNHIEQKKALYPNAYKPWHTDDDDLLARLYNEGASVEDLMVVFQRNRGSITSRLRKLGLA